MALLRRFLLRLYSFLHPGRADRELTRELTSHLALLEDAFGRQGLRPEEARLAARRASGGVEQIKELHRDARSFVWLDDVSRDVAHGVRTLTRAPSFTIIAILTLVLSIGAASGVLTVLDSIVLDPLPFPDAGRLVWIENANRNNSDTDLGSRMSQFTDWQQHAQTFDAVGAWNRAFFFSTFNLTGMGEPERLTGIQVSQSLFPMLGATAAAGRLFREGEDRPGAVPVVVLSHGLWQRRLAGSPDIIGSSLTINDRSFIVVGVLPPDVFFLSTLVPGTPVDVFVPLEQNARAEQLGYYLSVVGRLRDGASIDEARAELAARQAALAAERPSVRFFEPGAEPLHVHVTRAARAPLLLLVAGVGCLIVIGWANLTNLLLARTVARTKELATRAALGATRGRLFRQVLTEGALLAALGGALSVGVSAAVVNAASAADALPVARLANLHLDATAFWSTLTLIVAATTLIGMVPGLLLRRSAPTLLRSHGGTAARGSRRIQGALVCAQVGLALALVLSAGLLTRSFWNVLQVDAGFRPTNVVAVRVDPGVRYAPGGAVTRFFDQVLEHIAAVPGVHSVALTSGVPLDRPGMGWDLGIPGRLQPTGANPTASTRLVSPGYFHTLGIPLLQGRDFHASDDSNAPQVVIVNQSLARLLESRDPLGSRLLAGGDEVGIVGIVADVKHKGIDQESGPEMYLPFAQVRGFNALDVVFTTALAPASIIPSIRRAVWQVDPRQAVGQPVLLEEVVKRSLLSRRLLVWLVGVFASAALAVTVIGIYGVVSYSVATRTQEIGIRIALGAAPDSIRRGVLRDTLKLTAAGIVVGSPLAAGAGGLLRSFLFGVDTYDTQTVAAVGIVIVATALLAAYGPSRRAASVDPMAALRCE